MASVLKKLKAGGARVDGLLFNPDGTVSFAATNVGGAWSDAQIAAVNTALGLTPPTLTAVQIEAGFSGAIQTWLDQTAQAAGYNSLATAVSYQSSSVALWAKQAASFAAWRDAVWQAAIALLAEVQAGTQPLPASNAALLALLPQPSIPTS